MLRAKLVVERDELALEQFVRRSRWDSEDEEQRNRMILLAQVPEAPLEAPRRTTR